MYVVAPYFIILSVVVVPFLLSEGRPDGRSFPFFGGNREKNTINESSYIISSTHDTPCLSSRAFFCVVEQ